MKSITTCRFIRKSENEKNKLEQTLNFEIDGITLRREDEYPRLTLNAIILSF